ncbi:MAG: Methyltransferase [Sphingomonadales bacterium]|nr:Methyltransferase [Sphingomonadales bacterium]
MRSNQPKLEVVYALISSLRVDPRAPRTRDKRHVKQLAKSIDTFGFNVPVAIDDEMNIVSGHGRIEAALLLGMTEVPTIRLSHLSPRQRQAFMIADNRMSDQSRWNKLLLGGILVELADADLDFDLDATGFSVAEIDLLIAPEDPFDGEGPVPMPGGPAVTQLGDRWVLGDHAIVCGSALDPVVYRDLMGTERASVVVTDPPFNVPIAGNVSGLGRVKHSDFVEGCGEMSEREFTLWLEGAMRLAATYSRDGSLHYWAMDWRHLYELTTAARAVYDEQINLCVWAKPVAGMGSFYRSQHELFAVWRKGRTRNRNNVQLGRFGRSRTNIWTYAGATGGGMKTDEGNLLELHPTSKPVAMLADVLLDCTKRREIVLDPFLGGGSTIIAAEKVGRRARGIELDPAYVDVAIRRWQRWTGEHARLESDGLLFNDIERSRG